MPPVLSDLRTETRPEMQTFADLLDRAAGLSHSQGGSEQRGGNGSRLEVTLRYNIKINTIHSYLRII